MTDFGIVANFTLNSYVIRWGWTQSNDFFIVGLELSPFIQRRRCAGNIRMEKLSGLGGCSPNCAGNTRSQDLSDKVKNMKCRLTAIVLLTLSVCFLCASPAWAQVTKIKVGYSSIGVGQSLVWVAKEAGLFKENGLDLQLIFIGSSSM